MSTLRPLNAGYSYPQDADVTAHECQQAPEAVFTPRSALHDGMRVNSINTRASGPPNGNLNIDLPSYSRAMLSMEIIRDGKLTQSASRSNHHAIHLEALISYHEDNRNASSLSRRFSGSDTGTTRVSSEEFQLNSDESQTVGHSVQTSHSPRKSLPTHWLQRSSGPQLATAQRAKERSHKKDPQTWSRVEMKKIRGARSTVEIRKAQSVDGPNYLTKEALAAVETDIASPKSVHSPSKLHQSPSWCSPATSPLHSSPKPHTTLTMKMSPTRVAFLSAETAPGSHSRAPSSVAASCGTFYTANESPVRSPSGSEFSFQSASECLQEMIIPDLKYADGEMLQATRHTVGASPVKQKAATVGKMSSTKPRLAPKILSPTSVTDSNYPNTRASTTDGSLTSPTSFSPESPRLACRIPRLAGAVKPGSAYGATRSSTLKRAQSVRSLASTSNSRRNQSPEAHQVALPETPADTSLRHVRTVNSLGTTPILPSHPIHDMAKSCTDSGLHNVDSTLGISVPDSHGGKAPESPSVPGMERAGLTLKDSADQGSRTISITTVQALPSRKDPVPTDSAIIYSRKKVNHPNVVLGTTSSLLTENSTSCVAASSTASSVRSRSEGYPSETCQQTERQQSSQSNLGTELRATAPDFVPQSHPSIPAENTLVEALSPTYFDQAPWFPLDMTGFDKYGIPWFYYMYPVQFAYDQGFRNGRFRSPRKFHNKKQRQPRHPAIDGQQSIRITGSQPSKMETSGPPLATIARRPASGELMPPPRWPANRYQQNSQENCLRGGGTTAARILEGSSATQARSTPFARQLDLISQRDVLCNTSLGNRPPRKYDVDLTTVRNVAPLPSQGGEPYTNYHTVSSRHGRYHHRYAGNGLYNGRGSVGIPMSATTPFPDPSPPQGRPHLGGEGRPAIIGTEACGMVDVVFAAELGGGVPCNTCAPDH